MKRKRRWKKRHEMMKCGIWKGWERKGKGESVVNLI